MRRLSIIAGALFSLAVGAHAIGLQHGLFRSQSTQGAAWQGTADIVQEHFDITVYPDYLDVNLEWVFQAGGTAPATNRDALEIVGNLNLEANSVVVGMITWFNGKILKGKLKTDSVAREEYENVVDRSADRPPPPRDPVLLEWIRDDNYDISIFPVTFNGTRKVRIRYLVPAYQTDGVNKIAYPHAFTPLATVRIGAGPGVAGYLVETAFSKKQFSAAPALLDAHAYSFEAYSVSSGPTVTSIIPVLAQPATGSTIYVGAFSTPSFSGEMAHITTMSAQEALTKTPLAEDFVILWRWNHPQILAKYARQVVEQSKLLTTFLATLSAANKRAALVIDKEGGERITFRLDRQGGREYRRMVAYLDGLGRQAIVDPPVRSTPQYPAINYDGAKALQEFDAALQAAMDLFRNNPRTLKHLLVLTAGPQLVALSAVTSTVHWDSTIDVSTLASYLRGIDAGGDLSASTEQLYWPGADISGFAFQHHAAMAVHATVGDGADTFGIQVLTPPPESCAYCTWQTTTEMHLYAAQPLRKEITWRIIKDGTTLGQFVESPRIVTMIDGMQYARLIGASQYLQPLADRMPSSLASTLGFIDEKYGLVALEQDSLPADLARQYENTGVPLLDPADIFAAADERADMPVDEWLKANPPQSMARSLYPYLGPHVYFEMAMPGAMVADMVVMRATGAPILAVTDAAARTAVPQVQAIYAQDMSGYVDYSEALAARPVTEQITAVGAATLFVKKDALVIDLRSLGIDNHGEVRLVLSDLSGRIVGQWSVTAMGSQVRLQMSANRIARGIYLLRVYSGSTGIVRRVVVR